ncbi:metallophosphoesterase family protein [Undibacterium sp. Ji50W]|uniref:metallophosphoesterase family protein n=1 Tax=Undibacterium sp. Ji50W TaxID=3413041 RepID=UPI003BF2B95D
MIDRRSFLKLGAVGGGAVFMSGLHASVQANTEADFYFVQLSDIHWGYTGDANPEAKNTLRKAIESVNALPHQPDFIIFTGDLTHTTDDPVERRRRMAEFKEIIAGLKVRNIRFIPGEHDASLDSGAAFKEYFGATSYSFDHKGVHFIALDNVSDAGARIGEKQLAWLEADLAGQAKDAPVVLFTHRPLFDLVPKWDWATRDGAQAVSLLMPYTNITVFYGHIHQEHHHMTGHIPHHAAKSLIFPLPAPGSQDKRTPLPWKPEAPFQGLGFREVDVEGKVASVTEFPVIKA